MNSAGRRQVSIFTLTNTLVCNGSGDGQPNSVPSTVHCYTRSTFKCLGWSWRMIAMIGGVTIGSAVLFRSLSAGKLL